MRSHPISNINGYPTCQVSHFLLSQLIDTVNAHVHALKDSLSLIRQLESISFLAEQNMFLTSADVAALFLSITIEDGMKALQWFTATHSSIPLNLQLIYLELARFVLGIYMSSAKISKGLFKQKIGTAMGTSFSVPCYAFHDTVRNTHHR